MPELDRVDERGEPVLAVRQALFLLAVPAVDPVSCGVAVKFGHFRPPGLSLLAKIALTVTTLGVEM